jgi:BirA family biotin operon repressor/biotin-[acetyl-CoA-carboxylase] ligase
LVAQGPYARVKVVEEVDSTNAELLRRAAKAKSARLTALLAEHQSAGRGRWHHPEVRPRPWIAPPRSSLIASVLVQPPSQQAGRRTMLGLVWALAAVEALDLVLPGVAGLKWPNDVMAAGRKLAGVLASSSEDGCVAIGIGLNVHQSEEQLPDRRAGSLALAGAPDVDRTWLAIAVLSAAATWYERWARDASSVVGAVSARMITLGRQVEVELPNGQIASGRAEAIQDDGALRLRQPSGRTWLVDTGELVQEHGE